jgi:drug/metabolite transporter (DMT)-like permease
MVSAYYHVLVVFLFVGSGTLVSLIMNVAFDTQAEGRNGEDKKFKKPWCAMVLMCLAMSSVLLKYVWDRRRALARAPVEAASAGISKRSLALKIATPAFIQLLGTFLQSASLLWVPVSVYQMLQASIILFSALVRYLWMGKGLTRFESLGIVLTAVGLAGVGAASLVSGNGSEQTSPMVLQLVGLAMLLSSQALLALEMVMEEHFLQGFSAPAELVCGMVGLWGLVFNFLIFIPLAQIIPGEEGNGLHEDSIDTLYMIRNSATLQILLAGFFFVILSFNLTMRMLVSITQATTMQVLGGLRTLCVWVFALLMGLKWPQYGEQWKWSSWIELAGFLVLMSGVFIYRATVKLPCFTYLQVDKTTEFNSQDSTRAGSGLSNSMIDN